MKFTTACTMLAMFLLGGCAAGTDSQPLSLDHPANPLAEEAALPPPSDTLAINNATDIGSKTASQPEMNGMEGMSHMGHMHHNMSDMKHDEPASKPSAHSPRSTQSSTTAPTATYTCPMHHEVVSPTPGKCPKCQMKLVLKGEKQ